MASGIHGNGEMMGGGPFLFSWASISGLVEGRLLENISCKVHRDWRRISNPLNGQTCSPGVAGEVMSERMGNGFSTQRAGWNIAPMGVNRGLI